MDYRSTYRSFINSYYLSEGLRITFGLTLPAVVGTFLHHEDIGITMSIGAVCVTIVDNAGPVIHRKNAMLVCNAVIFFSSLLTGFALSSPLATGILVAAFCFIFSMIGVYGARAGSIGLAGLFVMVLNFTHRAGVETIILNAFYILCGGIWYMLLSLSLYSFRPYKVTQQALGDLVQATGAYILWRTAFYSKNPDYDSIYSNLLEKQAEINEKQNLVRELLYKSRNIVKESTNTGRITLLIFIDINDLFERLMSLQLHHRIFHEYFDQSDILDKFKNFLLLVSEEMNETGIALKSGRAYLMTDKLENSLAGLKADFENFRKKAITADNVEGFIGLKALLNACDDFVSRILTIQQYTAYDRDFKKDPRVQNYDQFVSHQDMDARIFWNNFSWKSNTFRHAVRVAFATTLGFIVSAFFPFGHSYWIMLTIIVILKPAYSITKRRNRDRLLGTIIGAGIGVVVLMVVKEKQLMIAIMIVLMVLAYSFMRNRYLLFVTLMTPYILILLYILNPLHFNDLIVDRIIDTAIGSAIALLANFLFAYEWAYKQFAEYLQQMLMTNKNYFSDVSSFVTGDPVNPTRYKLSRKEAYVSLANISDALNRMISEPKSKQKNSAEYHQIVVLNYMMSTHIATLASMLLGENPPSPEPDYLPVVRTVIANIDRAMEGLKKKNGGDELPGNKAEEPNDGRVSKLLRNKAEVPNDSGKGELTGIKTVEPKDTGVDELPANKTDQSGGPGKGAAMDNEDERAARDGLNKINEKIAEMVAARKKELEQGITETRIRLSVVKSVNDQFNFIWKISEDLVKSLRA